VVNISGKMVYANDVKQRWDINMQNGLTTEVQCTKVIDGDTIEVKLERKFHVRLRGMDAVELKSLLGEEAKKFVEDVFKTATEVQIFIPSNNPTELMDINSFGRIVADVYVDGESLAEKVRAAGYEKPNPKKKT
jgi:endonuclease YncB( thermonuclease family)